MANSNPDDQKFCNALSDQACITLTRGSETAPQRQPQPPVVRISEDIVRVFSQAHAVRLEQADWHDFIREWEWASRKKMNDIVPYIWYRPADTLMFVLGTARSELKQGVQNIVTRKIAQLGMTMRVMESRGVKIKDMLVKLDTGSVFLTCSTCKSVLDGASHTHSGAQ